MQRNSSHPSKIRNLDEIQEADPGAPRPSKLGALVLASLGGACVVLASVMLLKKPSKPMHTNDDPLGALVAKAGTEGEDEGPVGVTFPKQLAGGDRPTAALESVRETRRAQEDDGFVLPAGAPTEPPPAADRLPVVPLPAAQILSEAGKETVSRPDSLTTLSRHVSRDLGTEVAAGSAGGFQLQVSSFKTHEEAESFAAALRRRGHHAYVEAADVKGRGTWHRVRVGPFKYKRSAEIYRTEFEAKERIVTFIVSPPKTKVRVASANLSDADE